MTNVNGPPAKKALCIGIQYSNLKDKDLDLEGSHQDSASIRELLISKYDYPAENITMLLDDHDEKHTFPSRENILIAMKDLVKDAKAGDRFVFQYSGHGSQILNKNSSEADGYDEIIWPADVILSDKDDPVGQYIIDDDLKAILVDSLPPGAELTAILDCCHSGSALDLPYDGEDEFDRGLPSIPPASNSTDPTPTRTRTRCKLSLPCTARAHPIEEQHVELTHDVRNHDDIDHEQSGAFVVSWAACRDDQVGLENDKGGVLIESFIKVLNHWHDNPTHHQLTNMIMLEKLSIRLLESAYAAKAEFEREGVELVPPKPQLGSLRHIKDILHLPFSI